MGVWGKVRVLWRKDGSVGKGKRAREKERGTRRKVRRMERREWIMWRKIPFSSGLDRQSEKGGGKD